MQQEVMEAEAREALWREELIEEIEQKVGGLKEIEEAAKKEEELVKWFISKNACLWFHPLSHYYVYN